MMNEERAITADSAQPGRAVKKITKAIPLISPMITIMVLGSSKEPNKSQAPENHY